MPNRYRSPIGLLGLCSITAACNATDASPRLFARSEWAAPLVCPAVPALSTVSAVADVSNVSDSTFAVLLGDERKLLIFDAAFRQVDSMTFDKNGPRGVLRPVSAVVTDTMLFIADDARSSIRYFTAQGSDAGTAPLSFIPRRLRMVAGKLVVTPLVAGGSPAHLVFEMRGRKAVPLGGDIARYDDVGVNTLANMTSVASFADRLLVMHEMVVPFGYVIRLRRRNTLIQRFAVPVPADVASRLGRVPREPLTDRNVNQLAVVAFTAASVPETGGVYYVTRTGGSRGRFQKLLVGLDSSLNVVTAVPISVSPQHMIYVSARRSLVVVNSDSEWFECRVS